MKIKVAFVFLLMAGAGCSGFSFFGDAGHTVPSRLVSSTAQDNSLLQINSLYLAPVVCRQPWCVKRLAGLDVNGSLEAAYRENVAFDIKSGLPKGAPSAAPAHALSAPDLDPIFLGKQFGCDAVLLTEITQLVPRIGSNVGVERPAELAFHSEIVSLKDNSRVWQASYSFKDQALSENLFKLGDKLRSSGGLSWESLGSIVSSGFSAGARDVSARRLALFINDDGAAVSLPASVKGGQKNR